MMTFPIGVIFADVPDGWMFITFMADHVERRLTEWVL